MTTFADGAGPAAPVLPLATLRGPAGGPLGYGRGAGTASFDPLAVGPRRGRARRWRYVAAGGSDASVGAAVVDLGVLTVAFAWAQLGTRTWTWEHRAPLGRGVGLDRSLDGGALLRAGRDQLRLGRDGSLQVAVGTPQGRLTAWVRTMTDVTPAVVVTPTPSGGWNATQKAAGTVTDGWVRLGGAEQVPLGAGAAGWRDATVGRQDRRTTWRWAAGGGVAEDGRSVGLNLSTGMNQAVGEDVVWWDGVPYALPVTQLAPVDDADPAGGWSAVGPGWQLRFTAAGVRRKHERLGPVTSAYVQPIGGFTGTLPDPLGRVVPVRLTGVTEDHLAVW